MTLGYPEKLMKELRFYKETLGTVRVKGRGACVLSALAARLFGSMPVIPANTQHLGNKPRYARLSAQARRDREGYW